MKRKKLLSEAMMCISGIINILMYLLNIISYMELVKYTDGASMSHGTAAFTAFLMASELILIVLLSGTINKDASPFHKLYTSKTRVMFGAYIVLIILRYITLTASWTTPKPWLIYSVTWGVMACISTIVYISICRNLLSIIKNDEEKCKQLEKEYIISLSEAELDIMQKIKRSLVIIVSMVFVTDIAASFIINSKIICIVYLIAYMIAAGIAVYEVLRYYHKKTYLLITVSNSVLAGAGCTAIWLLYNSMINIPAFSGRTLDELLILQIVFLLPCVIWLSMKYKRYRRHKFLQIAENLKI